MRKYRIRSVVVGSGRKYLVQRREGLVDGRESWRTVASSYQRSQAEVYLTQATGRGAEGREP